LRAPAPVDRLVARVCKAKNSLFDGEGARRVGGRWNHPGTAVVYTADHAALAVLEVLAHLDQVPTDYVLIMATVPADVIETIDELNLPGWLEQRHGAGFHEGLWNALGCRATVGGAKRAVCCGSRSAELHYQPSTSGLPKDRNTGSRAVAV
jgi:hypothetical protein